MSSQVPGLEYSTGIKMQLKQKYRDNYEWLSTVAAGLLLIHPQFPVGGGWRSLLVTEVKIRTEGLKWDRIK